MTRPTQDKTELTNFIAELVEHTQAGTVGELFGCDEAFYTNVERTAYKLYQRSRYDRARVLLEGLIALTPTRAYPQLLLGDILLRQRSYDDARSILSRALAAQPRDPMTLCKLGEACVKAKDYDEARTHLARVIEFSVPRRDKHARDRATALLRAIDSLSARAAS